MHEMSIAEDMIRRIEAIAAENNAVRIESIELDVGVLRLIVPEAMQAAFSVLAAGTAAEGAELTITELAAEAECTQCGIRYPVTVEEYLCPQCHLATANIISGNDIVIKSLVCHTQESDASHED